MKISWFPHQRTLGHANPERDFVRITQPPRIRKIQSSRRPRVKMSDLTNFDWTGSMLLPAEIARMENLLVEFHDTFARHRFDIVMNEDFKVKLTTEDDSPACSQSLPTLINLKEDIL